MQRRLDTLQKIEIAEGVEIDLRPAGLPARGGAFLLDVMIKIGIGTAIAMLAGFIGGFATILGGVDLGSGLAMGLTGLAMFILEWGYSIYFEASAKGATPGKRAFKLRVTQLSGAPITFNQAVVRNMLRVADLLPLMGGAGLVSILCTKRFQRLGDLAAETVVVYSGEIDILNREKAFPESGETLRPIVNLNREEQMAIVLFAERSRDWTTSRQEELAERAGGVINSTNEKERVKQLFSVARWIRSTH